MSIRFDRMTDTQLTELSAMTWGKKFIADYCELRNVEPRRISLDKVILISVKYLKLLEDLYAPYDYDELSPEKYVELKKLKQFVNKYKKFLNC